MALRIRPPRCSDFSSNGWPSTSAIRTKTSGSSSHCSSSDLNPWRRLVETMNCRPGRFPCLAHQVNPPLGTAESSGTEATAPTSHAADLPRGDPPPALGQIRLFLRLPVARVRQEQRV